MHCISRSLVLVLPTLAAAAVLATLEGDANAAIFLVNFDADSPDFVPGDGICAGCTLRSAVMETNATAEPDTIFISPAIGPIDLVTTGTGEDLAATGDLDIWGNVTIIGNGAVIDGLNNDRIFHVHPGAHITIIDVTLNDGWGAMVGGGAIYNQGDLSLTGCTIEGNAAALYGGGIMNVAPGLLDILGSDVIDNQANQGGGIYSNAPLIIEQSFIEHNDAALHGGGLYVATTTDLTEILDTRVGENTAADHGGGIFTVAPMSLTGSTVELNGAGGLGGGLYMNTTVVEALESDFVDNEAYSGGGIHNMSGELTLQLVGIWNNFASYDGGGIDNRGLLVAGRGAIYANTADTGAGIYNYGAQGQMDLGNMTISGNVDGGGLWIDASSVGATMNGVTVIGNSGAEGGISAFAPTVLLNTLVGGHGTSLAPNDCDGTITSNGHNMIELAGGCVIVGPATADMYGKAPGVGALTSNGGRTPTHALLTSSVARNSGHNGTCLKMDQRGVNRPQGGTCDRGAFERN